MNKLALLVFCSLAGSRIAFAQDLSPDQAHQLGQAYATLAGYSWTMVSVGTNCGGDTKDLVVVWRNRNVKQQVQADALIQRMVAQITRQNGPKAAGDFQGQFRQQMDQLGKASASQTTAQLQSLPPEQRALVCKKWDASVRAGEWDVARKAPSVYKFLASMTQ